MARLQLPGTAPHGLAGACRHNCLPMPTQLPAHADTRVLAVQACGAAGPSPVPATAYEPCGIACAWQATLILRGLPAGPLQRLGGPPRLDASLPAHTQPCMCGHARHLHARTHRCMYGQANACVCICWPGGKSCDRTPNQQGSCIWGTCTARLKCYTRWLLMLQGVRMGLATGACMSGRKLRKQRWQAVVRLIG